MVEEVAVVNDRHHPAVAASAVAALPTTTERLLPAISGPQRLRLLYAVHTAPHSTVGELAAATATSPNTTTKLLHRLRDEQLVDYARVGRQHRWMLADDDLHDLLHRLGAPHSELHPPH